MQWCQHHNQGKTPHVCLQPWHSNLGIPNSLCSLRLEARTCFQDVGFACHPFPMLFSFLHLSQQHIVALLRAIHNTKGLLPLQHIAGACKLALTAYGLVSRLYS
jgi:hypothetical protein